jgi:hypothetical protein
MAEKIVDQGRVRRSKLERDLEDGLAIQANKPADDGTQMSLVKLMELMASMERPSRLHVTSYPACNSEL